MSEIIESHADRLSMLANKIGTTVTALSKDIGYKNSNTFSRIITGKTNLTNKHISKIIERYPYVNHNFLKNGELPIILSPEEQLVQTTLLSVKKEKQDLMLLNIMTKLELIHKEIKEIKNKIDG